VHTGQSFPKTKACVHQLPHYSHIAAAPCMIKGNVCHKKVRECLSQKSEGICVGYLTRSSLRSYISEQVAADIHICNREKNAMHEPQTSNQQYFCRFNLQCLSSIICPYILLAPMIQNITNTNEQSCIAYIYSGLNN